MKKELTVMKAVLKADYDRHVHRFQEIKELHGSILLGDSMIAYLPLSEYKFGQSLLNFGIPGDTTTGVLNRLSQVIDLKPLKVWIHIGSNDLVLSDLSKIEIAENILKIRDMLIEKIEHVKVYIISITPVLRNHSISNMRYIEWRANDEIKEINQMLQNHLMKGEYINVFDLLIDSYGNLNIDYTKDGIHLNGEGYKVFIDEIKTLI
jgi:lysophospholipase L1-like esterase